jgi:hypothetical protein
MDQLSGDDRLANALGNARNNLEVAYTRATHIQDALSCPGVNTTGSDQYGPTLPDPVCPSGLAGTPPGR